VITETSSDNNSTYGVHTSTTVKILTKSNRGLPQILCACGLTVRGVPDDGYSPQQNRINDTYREPSKLITCKNAVILGSSSEICSTDATHLPVPQRHKINLKRSPPRPLLPRISVSNNLDQPSLYPQEQTIFILHRDRCIRSNVLESSRNIESKLQTSLLLFRV
jgi:hypothetical protein